MRIYKTTNTVNNKIYIGQTTLTSNADYLGSGNLIKAAIRKYGRNAFVNETIEECKTQDELNEREKYWIAYYNSTDLQIGYNLSKGGEFTDPSKYRGAASYLMRMSEEEREAHLNKYRRGENFWKSKGIFTEEDKQKYLDERYPMLDWKNRFQSRDEYRAWVKTTNRGANFKTEEYRESMKGRNNAIFRGKTEEEIEQWLNENRRGENSSSAKYEYTLERPDGSIIKTRCLSATCKEYGFNLHVLRKLMELDEGLRSEYVPREKEYLGWKVSKKLVDG
jgi:hypothetical protein